MQRQSFYDRKLAFFENKSYYGKADRLPVDPALYDGGRMYEFQKILQFAQFPKNASIIELGAGYGKYVMPLLYMGYKVTAVDIGKKLLSAIIQKSKKYNLLQSLKTIQSDFRVSGIKNKYDTALCISTFHLLAETEKERLLIFSNLIKSVKPGGELIVIEPNPLNPLFYPFYLGRSDVSWNIEKDFLYSNEWNLRRIFKSFGLREIKLEYVGFLPIRLIDRSKLVGYINDFLNKLPFIQKLSSFIYIKGKKI